MKNILLLTSQIEWRRLMIQTKHAQPNSQVNFHKVPQVFSLEIQYRPKKVPKNRYSFFLPFPEWFLRWIGNFRALVREQTFHHPKVPQRFYSQTFGCIPRLFYCRLLLRPYSFSFLPKRK